MRLDSFVLSFLFFFLMVTPSFAVEEKEEPPFAAQIERFSEILQGNSETIQSFYRHISHLKEIHAVKQELEVKGTRILDRLRERYIRILTKWRKERSFIGWRDCNEKLTNKKDDAYTDWMETQQEYNARLRNLEKKIFEHETSITLLHEQAKKTIELDRLRERYIRILTEWRKERSFIGWRDFTKKLTKKKNNAYTNWMKLPQKSNAGLSNLEKKIFEDESSITLLHEQAISSEEEALFTCRNCRKNSST